MEEKGGGFSKYKNILVNRFKETEDNMQGIFFYMKNIRTKNIWTNINMNYLTPPEKYSICFSPDSTKITRLDGNIESTTKVTVSPEDNVEIRRLELINNGNSEEIIEVTSYLEPVLSTKEADISHPMFNNLFLRYEYLSELNTIIIRRKDRHSNGEDIYMAVFLDNTGDTVGELEFEIDKEKFFGRDNFNLPKMVAESKPFSKKIELVTESAIALKRSIKLNPSQKVVVDLAVCVSEDKEELIEIVRKYKNRENINRIFELSKARAEIESSFMELKAKEIETYQKMLGCLVLPNPMRKLYMSKTLEQTHMQSEFWKYGISGDKPIVLLRIEDIDEIDIVYELLKAHEFFRVKNIDVDLIILDKERNVYEQYVKEAIEKALMDNQISYLKDESIFILNSLELPKEDRDLFAFKANLIFDAGYGDIQNQLRDLEEEYLDNIKIVADDPVVGLGLDPTAERSRPFPTI